MLSQEQNRLLFEQESHAIQHRSDLETEFQIGRSTFFMLLKPRMFIDGDQWCALYGENLQDGVAGFGDSPELASYNFDDQWQKKLTAH